jgi:hypothetical protein
VLLGRSLHRFIALSCVVLLAGASSPELVCCCDISWGPAGLIGCHQLCKERCGKSGDKCCCTEQSRETDSSTDSNECGRKDCECKFTVVGPPPMVGTDTVKVDMTLSGVPPINLFASQRQVITPVCRRFECPGFFLMPVDRCALLQTWLA